MPRDLLPEEHRVQVEGQRSDLSLWTPPDDQPSALPVTSKLEALPLTELSWANAERLFVRLLQLQADVLWAERYGVSGQNQQGIDAYAYLSPQGKHGQAMSSTFHRARPYITLQSKRVRSLNPSDIVGAIDRFLTGTWARRTRTFYYATTHDLTDTKFEAVLRDASDRLQTVGVDFIPWGASRVNEMLRSSPTLVDDFFGRPWVGPFCGREALSGLAHRLDFADTGRLRQELKRLYGAVFASQAAVGHPKGDHSSTIEEASATPSRNFIILDTVAGSYPAWGQTVGDLLAQGDRYETPNRRANEPGSPTEIASEASSDLSSDSAEGAVASSRSGWGTRRSLRSVQVLLDLDSAEQGRSALRTPADVWLANGTRNVLVGDPGSGKSSLLQFLANDLLSNQPSSNSIQRHHTGRLPVWLPFSFLCRHLASDQSNSVTTALKAWIDSQSAEALWQLIERSLEDDRLLLLIDGIDEWTSVDQANFALGRLEAFLGHRRAAAFLSTRPYALQRISPALSWRTATLAPMTADQQTTMAEQYLPSHQASGVSQMGQKTAAAPFLTEIRKAHELSELARTPLFLALLASSWRGQPLPSRRYEIARALIDLMIERHPQMRRRSSNAARSPISASDFRVTIEAVAYELFKPALMDRSLLETFGSCCGKLSCATTSLVSRTARPKLPRAQPSRWQKANSDSCCLRGPVMLGSSIVSFAISSPPNDWLRLNWTSN